MEGRGAGYVYLGDVEGFTVYGDGSSVRRAPFESVDLDEEGFFAEVGEGGEDDDGGGEGWIMERGVRVNMPNRKNVTIHRVVGCDLDLVQKVAKLYMRLLQPRYREAERVA